ncbi:MAG: hypothetical protein H7842_02295 [Gammaproteobacteria bacterium SHHR-1]
MRNRRDRWIWYFFVIIGVGTASSFTFVGKFNPRNADQPNPQAIQLLWPEQGCNPVQEPCAALGRDKAVVARLYPLRPGYRLLLRTQGLSEDHASRIQAVWLDASGVPLGEVISLRPARGGGVTGDLQAIPGAQTLRISLRHLGQMLVAELPMQSGQSRAD